MFFRSGKNAPSVGLGEQDPIRSQSWRCARCAVPKEKDAKKKFRAPEMQKDGSEQRVQLP